MGIGLIISGFVLGTIDETAFLGIETLDFLTTTCPNNKGFLHLFCHESRPKKIPRSLGLSS